MYGDVLNNKTKDLLLLIKQARLTDRDFDILSDAEKCRADAMTEGARPAFVTARASLRRLLGTILETDPKLLPLHQEGTGPVVLQTSNGEGPFYSVSHTGAAERSYVAVAASSSVKVGVDIEQPDRDINWMRLAERRYHFGDLAMLKILDPRAGRQRFFELWTLKEAILKLEHGKLMTYLADVQIDMSHETPQLAANTPGGHESLDLKTKYLGDIDVMLGLATTKPVNIEFAFDRPRAVFS